MYRKEGGAFPDPILNLTWNYTNPVDPDPEELAKDMNGRALADLKDATGAVDIARRPVAGQLRPVARRRHDGVGLLDLLGLLYREGQPDGAPRRDRPARAGYRAELGLGVAGQPADPLQPRQRRPGRQSLEPEPSRSSNGTAARWVGIDVPDYAPTDQAVRRGWSVHHERRRRRAPVRPRPDGRGPVPGTLRAVRNRRRANVLHPKVQLEPGGAGVRRRPGGLRDRGGLPVCRRPPTG